VIRFVALFDRKFHHKPDADKVTLVWWSEAEHQCRVLYWAVPLASLDDCGALDGYFWIFDLLKRRRLAFGERHAELEEGWTIGEETTAQTTPSNWSPPGTPLGKLYKPASEWS